MLSPWRQQAMKTAKFGLTGLGLVGIFGLACAAEPATSDNRVDTVSTENPPASFEEWLRAQCQDGAAVGFKDKGTDELVKIVPCEELRTRVLTHPSLRVQFLSLYTMQPQAIEGGEPTEQTGEAKEPLLFGGLLCGFMAMTPGLVFGWPLHGCQRNSASAEKKQACEDWIGGSTVALGTICMIGFLF
jgi:hypothetical protein